MHNTSESLVEPTAFESSLHPVYVLQPTAYVQEQDMQLFLF